MDATTEDFNAWLAQEGAKVGINPPERQTNYLRDVYGEGYLPANVSDTAEPDPTTASVLANMDARYSGPGGYLRALRDKIPESGRSLDPRGEDESLPSYWGRALNSSSAKDMTRGGLNTMANWLQNSPEIGPDTLAPLGMAPMGSLLTPKNAVGVFGGRLAKTADHAALAKAEEMTGRGFSREDVWHDTGWFQGADGKWRFEVDDSGTKWAAPTVSEMEPGRSIQTTVGEALPHPKLTEAYPDAAPMPLQYVNVKTPQAGTPFGFYAPDRDAIAVRATQFNDPRSTTLHEAQHAVQQREGFARGSNSKADGPDHYRSSAGEVEARNVQRRQDMDRLQRRATPPWKTQDVPDEQQIVRLLSDQSKSSLPGTIVNSVEQGNSGIKAYHGSPHDFDRFSTKYIGKGEGNQSYGRGLYFAESEEVAKTYRDRLADKGRMYEVRINAKPEEFIEDLKPLARQSREVQSALKHLRETNQIDDESYRSIAVGLAPINPEATKALARAGIKGVRYLDQFSRGKGEGTANYVVFSDKDVEILKKWGWTVAGPAAGGGMMMTSPDDAAAAERTRGPSPPAMSQQEYAAWLSEQIKSLK